MEIIVNDNNMIRSILENTNDKSTLLNLILTSKRIYQVFIPLKYDIMTRFAQTFGDNTHMIYNKVSAIQHGPCTEYEDEIISTQGKYVNGFYDGPHYEYYANGVTIAVICNYWCGLLHGEYIAYHSCGCVEERKTYHYDLLHGVKYIFECACNKTCTRIISITPYMRGEKHGTMRMYENDGTIHITPYLHNMKHGTSIVIEGDEEETLPYINGMKSGMMCIYVNNKLVTTKEYLDNKLHGLVRHYSDGRIMKEMEYVYDVQHGRYEVYTYINGDAFTIESATYEHNRMHGIQYVYHDERVTNTTFEHGVRHGPCITYKNGEIVMSLVYDHNKLIAMN